jgi:hypothetical protein
MNFPADGSELIFFGAEQTAAIHCFECWLDFGV